MAWRIAIAATAVIVTLGTLALDGKIPASGHAYPTEAQARSVAIEFFRSQNERQYDRTCALLSRGFYASHRLPDRQTCVASLRVSFLWSGPIAFRIGAVERDGNRFVVHAVADGAPGRIVLVRQDGDLKIVAVQGQ
jgi:hypothetical protein